MTREEAIEVLKKKVDYFENDKRFKAAVEMLIPELTESEDERTRKEIINFILYEAGRLIDEDTEHRYIAYLEKQKEPVVDKEGLYYYLGGKFIYCGYPATGENPYDFAMSQQETHYTKRNELFDKCVENCDPKVMKEVSDKVDEMLEKEQKPIEIKIDNPNIQKFDPDVKVTTSESSASGKELLYVSNKSYDIGYRDGVNSVKPAEWSEEDEEYLELVTDCVYEFYPNPVMKHKLKDWLKSLSVRFNLQPKQEWSEEDEKRILQIERIAEQAGCTKKLQEKIHGWLMSLRPSWKPSEEQMESLNYAIAEWDGGKKLEGLYALRNDLRKLVNEQLC